MKKFLFVIAIIFASINLFGQSSELKIVKDLFHKGSVSAKDCLTRSDGTLCAKIDFIIPGVKFDLEGEILEKTKITNGYRVQYAMRKGKISIIAEGYLPKDIMVNEPLEGGELYEIQLVGFAKGNVSDDTQSDYAKMPASIRELVEMGDKYLCTIDKATAAKYYQKAADQNNAYAQFRLGTLYYYGDGVPQNNNTARTWFQKSANQGNEDAKFYLNLMK